MKRASLTVILVFCKFIIFSQTLYNTYWAVHYQYGVYGYFHFSTDTLYLNVNNLGFTPISTFQENGDSISITDLPGTLCGQSSIGVYTFNIQNDTLIFTHIQDPCGNRDYVLTQYKWIFQYSTIPSINPDTLCNIFPNPSKDGVFHLTLPIVEAFFNIGVYNLDGKKIMTQDVFGKGIQTIRMDGSPSGIYLLKGSDGTQTFIKELIIQRE